MADEQGLIEQIHAITKGYQDLLSKYDNENDRNLGLYEKYRKQFDMDCRRDVYNLLTYGNPDVPSFDEYMRVMDLIDDEK